MWPAPMDILGESGDRNVGSAIWFVRDLAAAPANPACISPFIPSPQRISGERSTLTLRACRQHLARAGTATDVAKSSPETNRLRR
jgi:hypothetical protein